MFFISIILGVFCCLNAQEAPFFEEQKQLNQALQTTLQTPPFLGLFGRARWNARLGDLYFSLNAYPQARLFYERALFFTPENPLIMKNLEQTLFRLGLQASPPSWRKKLAMEWFLPEAHRWSLFFIFALLAIVLRRADRLARYADRIAATFLVFALFGYFMKPVEAVLVRPAFLQSSPKESGAYLSSEPLLPGSKVELLQVAGDFVKVRLDGEVGFLPATYLFSV